jgi:hypothetical protein
LNIPGPVQSAGPIDDGPCVVSLETADNTSYASEVDNVETAEVPVVLQIETEVGDISEDPARPNSREDNENGLLQLEGRRRREQERNDVVKSAEPCLLDELGLAPVRARVLIDENFVLKHT